MESAETSDSDLSIEASPQETKTNDHHIFEAGVIEQVYVQDFMCHKKLTVDFGRHVNFITGANGSGKSAVVAAIQLCLGSSARRTGRGSNLSSLIRDGAQGGAILRVKLVNEGEEAFKPNVYGTRITVERRIPKSGQATYSLLNAANKVMSSDKAELERLLSHFNVAVENPCCVLTQDEAKRFIQGKEGDKYAFFLKATLLERTKEEIEEAEVNLQKARDEQRRNIQQIGRKEQNVKQLEQEAEELEAVARLGEQITRLSVDIAWATAKEQKQLCDDIEAKVPKRQQACDELQHKLDTFQQELDGMVGLDESEQLRLDGEINDIKDELVATQAAARTADSEVKNMESTIGRQKQEINREERKKKDRIAELHQKQSRATSSGNSDVQQKETTIERLRAEINQIQENIARQGSELTTARKQLADSQGRTETLNRQYHGIQKSIREGNAEIQRLQSMRSRAGAFGQFAEEIARRVEGNRRGFSGPVFGPVGLYVKLREEHQAAALAVERVIGRNMGSFIVTNDSDSRTLLRLMREVNNRAPKEHSIAVQAVCPRYEVPSIEGAVTVADAIAVEEPVIFNLLVDQAQIERVIITESEQQCEERWIQRDPRSHSEAFRHRDITQAVALDGTAITIRNGNRSSQSNTTRHKRLGVDVNEQVEALRQQLADDQQRATAAQRDMDEAARFARHLQEQVQDIQMRMDEMNRSQKLSSMKLQQTTVELEQLRAELNADLSPLESEINTLSEDIDEMQQKLQNMMAQLDELREVADQKRSVVNEVVDRKKVLEAQLDALQEKARECIVSRQTLLAKRDKAERDLAKVQKKLDDTNKILAEQQTELQGLVEYARQQTLDVLGDEWDQQDWLDQVEKSTEELQRAQQGVIATKEQEERRARGRNVNITQIKERLNTARAEWLATKDLIENVSNMLQDMTEDIEKRKRKWAKQLVHVSDIVATTFDTYMQRKGFSGNVQFDHELSKLAIRARTDNTDEFSQVDDIRQLSGGERSFTTLSLLLALGHVIDCPFRVMDEYDVFLDQVARTITIRQLIEYAEDPLQEGRQFIVITPQDLTAVQTNAERVRIVKMATPDR